MSIRIAHISDIHFGRITQKGIVDALVSEINQAGVDVVAVSGDLTQRARRNQMSDAREMLDSFTARVLVVPGNHDAYAWWYPIHRLITPVRRYRNYISEDLAPSHLSDDVAVLGISSVHGWTIKSGLIRSRDRNRIRQFFSTAEDRFKILVVHHHLERMPDYGSHDTCRFGRQAFDTAQEMGVDLLLSGHLHRSHVQEFSEAGSKSIVVASAGTATSNRGRNETTYSNQYNMISIDKSSFEIEERGFNPTSGVFESERFSRYVR